MGSLTFILSFFLILIQSSLLLGSQPAPGQVKQRQLVRQVSPLAQAEVDSLQALVQNTPAEAGKIKIYGQLCHIHASITGDIELAHSYADSVKLVAAALKDEFYLAASSYYYGMVARHECNYTEALNYLKKPIEYGNTSGNSSLLANSLYQMAVVAMAQGEYEKSLAIYYRTIKLFETQKLPYGTAITFMGLGNLLLDMNKYDDAIKMFDKTLALLNQVKADLNVKINKVRVLINLGNAYAALKQYEKARMFYCQSLPISRVLGSKRTEATALSKMGDVLNMLQQHDSALVYNQKALCIREQTSQREKIIVSLIQVGETHLFLKDYATAKRYLMQALTLSEKSQVKPMLRDTYQKLAALYAAQTNFRRAFEYHQLFAQIKDSVLNEETARQLSELQTRYETGEKDKQLAILAKEKQVQLKEVQRQSVQRKALAGGLVLVTIIALLSIFLLRQRMKNQKLLMTKNQQIKESNIKRQLSELETKALRAQMNPHFIFNCMNSINRMILDGDNDSASRYLTKLSKLIRMILENSEKATVSLLNELAMLDAYVQLENLRFKGRIRYEVTVHESIDQENTFLPSMVLQPFVENAIWHGLMHKEKTEQGFISISIAEAGEVLMCVIEDNGVGRELATALKKKSVVSRKSMGLQITEERLKLFNKGATGPLIQITDLKNSLDQALGTRVNIHVPMA